MSFVTQEEAEEIINKDNLQELTNKIKKAIPEIEELKFGCEVLADWGDKRGKIIILSSNSILFSSIPQ